MLTTDRLTLCLPSWDLKQPAITTGEDDWRRQIVVRMVAVQLLFYKNLENKLRLCLRVATTNDKIQITNNNSAVPNRNQESQELGRTVDSAQTRDRASTSGTIVRHPPLITKVSPEAARADSSGSTPSGTHGLGKPTFPLRGGITGVSLR